MAAKKKATNKLATAELRAATLASVKAALGKVPGGGIINGFVLSDVALQRLGVSANALAKDIAANTSAATGLRLEPAVIKRPGTILVGYLPPAKLLR
jgi:hypothetical protein